MIKLDDARVTDNLPGIVAGQEWAKAFSEAAAQAMQRTLCFAKKSSVYSALDEADSELLDAVAICMNVDWYDADLPVETKRNIIKAAMAVRKTAGTAAAVRKQVSTIYPSSEVAEWHQYGGQPGYFRVAVNINEAGAAVYTVEEMEVLLQSTKRLAAHLDYIGYMVKHGIETEHSIKSWKMPGVECGTVRCGQIWETATKGCAAGNAVYLDGEAAAFEASQPNSGTLPVVATVGAVEQGTMSLTPVAAIYSAKQPYSGITYCGQVGYRLDK